MPVIKFSMRVRHYGNIRLHTPRNVDTLSYELYKSVSIILIFKAVKIYIPLRSFLAYDIIKKEIL